MRPCTLRARHLAALCLGRRLRRLACRAGFVSVPARPVSARPAASARRPAASACQPECRYRSARQITTLLTYMNSQFASGLVLSINSSNGKLILSTTAVNEAISVESTSTCAEIFGMGTVDFYINGGPSGVILNFPYPLNLLGVKKISIKSSSLNIVAFSSIKNGYSDTICTIPADQPAFGMISYTSQNDLNRNILKQSVIDRIDIQLLDENQNYLDFNNLDWSITICLSNERVDREKDTTTIKDITNKIKPIELTTDQQELIFLQK